MPLYFSNILTFCAVSIYNFMHIIDLLSNVRCHMYFCDRKTGTLIVNAHMQNMQIYTCTHKLA